MTNTAPLRFRIISAAAINELLLTGVEDEEGSGTCRQSAPLCAAPVPTARTSDRGGMTRLLAGEPQLAVATQVDGLAGIELPRW